MKFKVVVYFFGLSFLLFGCVAQRNREYLSSDRKGSTSYEIPELTEKIIQPDDKLSIQVSSFDDPSFNYFQTQSAIGTTATQDELSLSSNAYTVDENGKIDFPILGKFEVAGLTIDEAAIKMEKELEAYFNQPIVKLRFAYKKFIVLGEVGMPGKYLYPDDPITLFEALAMAGDMTKLGNRKDVYLIRETDKQVKKLHIDVRDEELMFTEFYYIQPDDVIYVKSNRKIDWTEIAAPLSVISSSISLILIALTLSETYQFK